MKKPIFQRQISVLALLGILVPWGSLALAAEEVDPINPSITNKQAWAETTPKAGITYAQNFPDRDWWTAFQDTHLEYYINQALTSNHSLRAAVLRIDEGRATVSDNFANQLPQLSLSPSAFRAHAPSAGTGFGGTLKFFTLPLQASYELDLFGKYRDKTKSARKQLEATEQDAKAAEITLASDVASAYFNLINADALVETQTQNLQLLTRIHELEQSQNKIGLVSYEEVIRADRDVAEAQTNLNTYRKQQSTFAHQLYVLTGSAPGNEKDLPRSKAADIVLPTQINQGLPSELITRRPDILSQEKQLERSRIDVRVARKAYFPTINLLALVGLSAPRLGDLFKWDSTFDVESVNGSQPLYKGGRLAAGVKLQKARHKEQLENYQQTILNAFKEVEDNLALLNADYDTLNSNRHRLELTNHELGLTENLYQQGLVPRLNVLQSQSQLVKYQQLDVQSKMDTAIAMVGLYKALGGGF